MKMTRRWTIKALILAALLPACFLAIVIAFGREPVSASNLKSIQVGMTWREVTAILGPTRAGGAGSTADTISFYWEFWDGVATITFSLEGEWHVVARKGDVYEPTSLFVRRCLHKAGL